MLKLMIGWKLHIEDGRTIKYKEPVSLTNHGITTIGVLKCLSPVSFMSESNQFEATLT